MGYPESVFVLNLKKNLCDWYKLTVLLTVLKLLVTHRVLLKSLIDQGGSATRFLIIFQYVIVLVAHKNIKVIQVINGSLKYFELTITFCEYFHPHKKSILICSGLILLSVPKLFAE